MMIRPPGSNTTALCLSCSSTIPPKSLSSTYLTTCCRSPICARCLAANPRLRDYVPCLRCGDGVRAVGGKGRPIDGVERAGASDTTPNEPTQIDQFRLGIDSDEEDDDVLPPRSTSAVPSQPPPAYDLSTGSTEPDRASRCSRERSTRIDGDGGTPTGTSSRSSSVVENTVDGEGRVEAVERPDESEDEDDEEEDEYIEPMKHLVMKGETIRSLATRYGLDPYELIKLNSLPFEALQSNPQLLQTRRFVLLSRPSPRSRGTDGLEGEAGDDEEEEARKEERRLKRFQLVTKERDTSVARAYLAVQEIDDANYATGTGSDVLFSVDDELAQDEKKSKAIVDKERLMTGDMANKESRAVDKFFADDDWERQRERTDMQTQTQRQGSGSAARPAVDKEGDGRWMGLLNKGDRRKAAGASGTTVRKGQLLQGAPWLDK